MEIQIFMVGAQCSFVAASTYLMFAPFPRAGAHFSEQRGRKGHPTA